MKGWLTDQIDAFYKSWVTFSAHLLLAKHWSKYFMYIK